MRERIEQVANNNNGSVTMPDLSGLVTWDRLEDALRGIRESIEKSSTDAAAALASSRDQRAPVTLIERPSQTVSNRIRFSFLLEFPVLFSLLFFFQSAKSRVRHH